VPYAVSPFFLGGNGNSGRFSGGRGGGKRGGDGDQDRSYGSTFLPAPVLYLMADGEEELPRMNTPAFVGDPSKPLILLLSWMGAKNKHMERYRKYYWSKGYEVVTFLNGMSVALLPEASKVQAQRVIDVLEAQPDGRPIFVHAFSIGTGVYGIVLDHLMHDMERFNRIAKNVAGVIMDSGPAIILPKDLAVGLHTMQPRISKAIWNALAQALFWVTQARACFSKAEEALRSSQFPAPQIYFASRDDKVIRGMHEKIEQFVDTNRQRGLDVYQKIWDQSLHAGHFKIHPEEYGKNLEVFLGRCMDAFSKRLQPTS